jgi:hypothetical protein
MTETRQTNNDKMRHLLAQRAKARATSHLRAEFAEQFDILVDEEREKTPDDSRSITYRRAERRLRKLHPGAFNVWYALHQERLYREYGYVPASVHRRPPEVERAALALDILVRFAKGETQHLNMGSCPEAPDETGSRDPDCHVCKALNEVDSDAHLRQAA